MSLKYHIIHFIVKDIEKQLEIDQKKVFFLLSEIWVAYSTVWRPSIGVCRLEMRLPSPHTKTDLVLCIIGVP